MCGTKNLPFCCPARGPWGRELVGLLPHASPSNAATLCCSRTSLVRQGMGRSSWRGITVVRQDQDDVTGRPVSHRHRHSRSERVGISAALRRLCTLACWHSRRISKPAGVSLSAVLQPHHAARIGPSLWERQQMFKSAWATLRAEGSRSSSFSPAELCVEAQGAAARPPVRKRPRVKKANGADRDPLRDRDSRSTCSRPMKGTALRAR